MAAVRYTNEILKQLIILRELNEKKAERSVKAAVIVAATAVSAASIAIATATAAAVTVTATAAATPSVCVGSFSPKNSPSEVACLCGKFSKVKSNKKRKEKRNQNQVHRREKKNCTTSSHL